MTFPLLNPFELSEMPSQASLTAWFDNIRQTVMPMEQARWRNANLDQLFYSGNQAAINNQYGVSSGRYNSLCFNFLQQPVRRITGYQRQHRKAPKFMPFADQDSRTADQYTKAIRKSFGLGLVDEEFSRQCELSAVTSLVLAQPYLDYQDDPAQGDLKLKTWEFNSFITDPFWRSSLDEARFIACQEYISKSSAVERYKDKKEIIRHMSGTQRGNNVFYFLPEASQSYNADLLTLTHIWTRTVGKRPRIYSKRTNRFYEYSRSQTDLEQLFEQDPGLEIIDVEVPVWKLTQVLNETPIFHGDNPMGDMGCPMVPVYWDYEASISQTDLRARSLITPLRPVQWLTNRRIILNHIQSESNSIIGWKRKERAVANEDNLTKSNESYDIVIASGFELTDVEKILPNIVPQPNIELVSQLREFMSTISGDQMEDWSQDSNKQSALGLMIRQSQSMISNQKYMDQWDYSYKQIADKSLKMCLNNWNETKFQEMVGEELTPMFFSKVFAKYNVICEQGLNTAVQQQEEFAQWMELNQALGGIIPPQELAKRAVVQGKDELIKILEGQQQQQMQAAQSQQEMEMAKLESELRKNDSHSALNIATGRWRSGIAESDIGRYRQHLSAVEKNRADTARIKAEAMFKLLEGASMYGPQAAAAALDEVDVMSDESKSEEREEDVLSKQDSLANHFLEQYLQQPQNGLANQQQPM